MHPPKSSHSEITYEADIIPALQSVLEDEHDLIANAANTAALLYEYMADINWVGFYFLKDNELVLGPFQGRVACVRIPMGKGVCGTSALKKETILVEDVHQFEGHIACDSASQSEIVIPLVKDGHILGVLDIDSPHTNRFSQQDRQALEKIAAIFVRSLTS